MSYKHIQLCLDMHGISYNMPDKIEQNGIRRLISFLQ